jgi:hypothetical protein
MAVAATVAATTATTSCRDPVATAASCGGSLAAVALSTARSALDERRLMGTDASNLSALAGARAGTVSATLRTRRQETELQPFETGTPGGATTYLKVEKPRFLFLEGSAGAAVAPVVATAALPDASATCAGASAVGAASSTDRPAAGASAPATGVCSSAVSAALGEGGEGFHLSGGAAPHCSPLLPPLPTMSSPGSPRERVPAARAAGTPRPAVPSAPATGSSSPSCAPPAPTPIAAPRARPLGLGAWAGQTAGHPRSPSAYGTRQGHTNMSRGTKRKGEVDLPTEHR